jgi:hypothetical protein
VEELRRLGHDVVTLFETGKAEQAMPDEAVLAFARSERRVLLTLNRRHFVNLHNQSPSHPGIIVCTFDIDFVSLAHRIDAAIATQADLEGQLIRINRPQQ